MTVVSELADFVRGASFAKMSHDTTEHLKMHLLDTVGAMLIGPKTREGVAIGKLLGKIAAEGNIPVIGYSSRAALLPSIIASCAATRCTEIDDIHLESCTAPGSVIIPTALSLANAGYLSNPKDFLVAIAVGYEMMIRLGMAINGPKALSKGIWPTYLGAALGSAAVTSRALNLSSQQTTSAISTALTMSTGVAGRVRRDAPFTRWLTVGVAAQNGAIAALAAQEGFVADDALLDTTYERIYGLKLSREKLTDDLGRRFSVDDTGMKPHPIGRQSLSALEAFREIVTANHIDPESIQGIFVWVPKWHVSMVDRQKLPENRLESIGHLRYQMALVAYHPEKLLDVLRENLIKDSRVSTLMEKVHIKSSRELERHFPRAWPARVEVKTDKRRYSCKMLHPKGDSCNRFSWDEVISKFGWVAKPAFDEAAIEQVANSVRKLDAGTSLAHLKGLLT
ncbi:MmgE/PrpD family protein [Chloroflexota bacterium]